MAKTFDQNQKTALQRVFDIYHDIYQNEEDYNVIDISSKEKDVLEWLELIPKDQINIKDSHNNNLLGLACHSEHKNVINFLINSDNLDIDSCQKVLFNNTDRPDILKLLLKIDDIDVNDNNNANVMPPIYHAAYYNNIESLEILLNFSYTDIYIPYNGFNNVLDYLKHEFKNCCIYKINEKYNNNSTYFVDKIIDETLCTINLLKKAFNEV